MKRCPDTPPRPRERERPHRPRWRLPPQGFRPPAHRTERVPRRAWPPRARRSAALVRRVYSANTADITVRASRRLAGAARRVPPSSTVRVPPCQPCTRARARGRSRQRGAALRQQPRCAALDGAARRAAVRRAPHGQEEAAARVPVHRGGGVGASNGARLGQSCAGDARDAAPRGSQACSWPPMCGTRCVPAAVPRQNPPSAICYRARALAQRWCATPGLSATRRALEAWACLVVPVLTSAAIGAVVTLHNCLSLGRPSLRSNHTSSLVAQV